MFKLPEWKKNLAAMWFAQLNGMAAITGVIAFLPLYLPELGITTLEEVEIWSGILMAVASLCAAISGPHWGVLADRHGRKPMVERVMFIFFILMMAMAFVTNVYQLLVLRILQGLFGGFTSAALALVTSLTPPEEIGFTMGFYQTAMITGGAFGPLLGGFIADHFGYRQAFAAFGIMCIISLFIIHLAVTEHFVPAPQTVKPSVNKQIKHVLSTPGLKSMLLIQFAIQFAVQAIAPILPLYIQGLAPDSTHIASTCGSIIAITGLTSALASASMGIISKHTKPTAILFFSASLAALSFAGQAIATSVIILGMARGVSGLFLGAMLPTINAIVYLLIPPEKRGVAYGVTSSASLMGNVLGPLLGSLFALYLGTHSVFWLTAGLFAFVAIWSLKAVP
ncbi:MAG: multidrug transporter [Firmicutes bacterium]|nr:multidrug transporter [Bacillota bacterium]